MWRYRDRLELTSPMAKRCNMAAIKVYIHRPHVGSGRALEECIDHVAERTSYGAHDAAIVVSYFFQQIAERLANNESVPIPGFGTFKPYCTKGAVRKYKP